MKFRAKDQTEAIIEEIVRHLHERLPRDEIEPLERFVRQYYEDVFAEDFEGLTTEDLYGEALSLWRFLARRETRGARVRVYNPRFEEHGWQSTHTVVEIINDDMPFLVDSVSAALNRLDLTVHLLIHPVLRVKRDSSGRLVELMPRDGEGENVRGESIVHVEVTQQSGDAAFERIREALEGVLADVRNAVEDWRAMRDKVSEIIDELEATPPPGLPDEDVAESIALLAWVRDNHFTFLGYREYALETVRDETFLRVAADSGLGVLRELRPESVKRSDTPLTPLVERFARQKELLIITKANSRSTVHRPVYMDYIGIRRFDESGEVIGERRFLGLFTSAAYNRSAREIPLLRHKVHKLLARSRFAPNSHNGKALLNILDTFPRDELFQTPDDLLFDIAHGILHLEERQRIRLFIRRDAYARFFSCLVYVPRERYNTALRVRMEEILVDALNGRSAEFTVQVSEAVMARIHFTVHTPAGPAPDIDQNEIEARIVAATRLWSDDLRDACIDRWGEALGIALFQRYVGAFPAGYRDSFGAQSAVFDIGKIEALENEADIGMNLYNRIDAPIGMVHFKIYHPKAPVPLSDILPVLEHMGLKVIEEAPYRIEPAADPGYWIHDFTMTSRRGDEIEVARVRGMFQDAFARIWHGDAEDDGFNALVLRAGLSWREVAVLRAYCKYLRQTGIAFSQDYMEETLANNPAIARLVVELFLTRFDPEAPTNREARAEALDDRIAEALDGVDNLDEDRILRRFRNLVSSTLRTNYFQPGGVDGYKPDLALKLDSGSIRDLPLPRPWVEIFIYSPQFEAVHLRGGRVARGGIRWSDRREDFRTEVLGLMKAQMVKNAVIVPVGAKGGFVVKRPPAGGREALLEEGIACYRGMMAGLLDVTDNRVGDEVVAPKAVVRYDGDDPYLVVAADKGTAPFSDIANGVARDYGFWLDDAFASGGSSGYDHKKMAITARGAWESVKRHFRELGVDTQTTDFTCVGIGDMSGDVFGNGMLLSKHIRLIGAFNHLHVFFDPEPDAAKSYEERERLFKLPRSSWTDYDAKLISKGGGVFDRKAKSIDVTPAMHELLGIMSMTVTPNELIRALLLAPVDLLWNGGIGTYVKAEDESHAEVGDRGNDAVRVNGRELRCRVVGEGGNLGLTQRGRIEYALAGGRLNTDAIDNSAGVDCSDHEVNIKVLLGDAVASGDLTVKQRDQLLAKMTDELAELVLVDNYRQTQALTVTEAHGSALLELQTRLIRALERAGKLDPAIEDLPDEETLAERQNTGQGLTRPELSVLLAYAKITLYDDLLESDLPEDPFLAVDLVRYFPKPLQKRYRRQINRHRLRREIICTSVTNSMVNRVGATFVNYFVEETGFSPSEIARAYTITRDAFDLRTLWNDIDALDNAVPTAAQSGMLVDIGRLVERCTAWFLRNRPHPLDIAETIDAFMPGSGVLAEHLKEVASKKRIAALEKVSARYVKDGVPEEVAWRVARLEALASALDIVQSAERSNLAVEEVARVYFEIGERLGLEWLRASARAFAADSPWQRKAVSAIIDDLYGQQRLLTASVLEGSGKAVNGAVETWVEANRTAIERNERLLADLGKVETVDLAMLTVAGRQIRVLASG